MLANDIFSAFKEACRKNPHKEILSIPKEDSFTSLTYQDLLERINKVSVLLIKNNIKKQDPVAIIMENNPWWPAAFFGIMQLGAVAVPLNPQLEPDELKQFLLHSEAKIILTSPLFAGRLKNLGLNLLMPDLETPPEINIPEEKTLPEDIASIVYTSGTTAIPKGVILTHKNLLSNIDSMLQLNLIRPDDCLISVLPFYHVYPFLANLLLPLLIGAKISFPVSLDAQDILECSRKTKVSILIGVPRIFSLFREKISQKIGFRKILGFTQLLGKCFKINLNKFLLRDLHCRFGRDFRLMVSGGAKLKPEIARDFFRWGFAILEGYGLTETSPVVSFNAPQNFKIGSVGRVVNGVEVKINAADASGIGEILIKGENVTQGYYKEDALAQEAIKEGWFYSGDLGYLDKDGFLYITGRKKELIVLSSGKKIIPEELEEYLCKSHFIKEVCVFLLAQGKDSLCAVIVPDHAQFISREVTQVKDKIRWEVEVLSQKLAPYQRVKKIIVTNEKFPRTMLGKLKRFEIEKIYSLSGAQERKEEKLSPEDETLLKLPISAKIMDYISQETKKQARASDHLELDLGLDSLDQVGLFIGIQRATGIEIKEEERFGIFTVRDLLNKAKTASLTQPQDNLTISWQEILKQPLKEELRNNIILKQNLLARLANIILAAIFRAFCRAFFLLEIKGIQNLPKDRPFLLCANHTSYLDGPLIFCSLKPALLHKAFFLGYAAYFDFPLVRWAKKLLRLVGLDPVSEISDTLKVCSFLLENSKIVCVFPEGMRSRDGKVREFKRGVGILIKELNVAVVPVYISGTFRAWPAQKILPRPAKVKIIFGKELMPPDLLKKTVASSDTYDIISQGLRKRIMELEKGV